MAVGFTGTRHGMTEAQIATFLTLLPEYCGPFHHGDCKGADAQASDLASQWRLVISHPPTDEKLRAFTPWSTVVLPSKPYIERNHDIVDACDVLIGCPGEMTEQLRSGTWATIRYARKIGKKVVVIYPDGTVE